MKKFLLSSTALISLATGIAFAEVPLSDASNSNGPTVSFGGLVDFQAGFHDHKKNPSNNSINRDVMFNNTAKLYAKATARTDMGFTYGAVIGLKTTAADDKRNKASELDRTYLFVESEAGRFEMGSNYSAAKKMKIDASTLARATGGIDGSWYKYYMFNQDVYPITSPDNYIDLLNKRASEDTRKITYYSPRFSGLQFGVSYTPDVNNKGYSTTESIEDLLNPKYKVKNLFSGGVNFTQQVDQFAIALSATGETGKVTGKASPKKVQSYAFGGNVGYANFTVGGSYGIIGKNNFSIGARDTTSDFLENNMPTATKDAKYWTAGVGFVQGPIGASVNYMETKFKGMSMTNTALDNKFKTLVVGMDYQLAAGMLPYAEVAFLNPKMKSSNVKNKGTVFILGTELKM